MEFAELIKTPRVDGVVLHRPFKPTVEGTLCLTGHHLILSSRQDNIEELWLLHSNIDSIEKRWQNVDQFLSTLGSFTLLLLPLKELILIRSTVQWFYLYNHFIRDTAEMFRGTFTGNYYLIFSKRFFKLFLHKGFEEIIVIAESITMGNITTWLLKCWCVVSQTRIIFWIKMLENPHIHGSR